MACVARSRFVVEIVPKSLLAPAHRLGGHVVEWTIRVRGINERQDEVGESLHVVRIERRRPAKQAGEGGVSDAGVGIPAAGWDGMQRRVNAANGTPKIENSLFLVLADSDIVTTFGSTVFESN